MRIRPSLVLLAAASPALCAIRDLPLGDAGRGQAVFTLLNCPVCHGVNGVGGKAGPDLGRTERGFDPYKLAAVLWNHAPRMWNAQGNQWASKPAPSQQQFADLFIYIFSASYFEAPGNARRGKELFLLKRCGQCHGVGAAVRAGIKPATEWESPRDPAALAQRMWNHSGDMARALESSHVAYPVLTAQEITDVLAWLQSMRPPGEAPSYQPEAPESGRRLLASKGCTVCHRGTLTLEFHHTRYGLTDFAAAMWNHPFRTGHHQTTLSLDEMRSLLGYFVALQFSEERGNPEDGARLFGVKRCSLCHDNPASGAPPRASMAGRTSSFGMAAALWKHGPAMLASMQRLQIPWPRFKGAEMADISAFLYGRQLKRRPGQPTGTTSPGSETPADRTGPGGPASPGN